MNPAQSTTSAVRPDPPAAGRPGTAVSRVATACFWAYLAALTVATHVPRVDPEYLATVRRFSPLQPDKTLHLVAYAILGGLAGAAFGGGGTAAATVRLFVALACWAFLDEITQPLFGRDAELGDWLHDLAGLAVGLTCALLVRRRRGDGRPEAGQVPPSPRQSS